MTDDIVSHETALARAFASVIRAEERQRAAKGEIERLRAEASDAEADERSAWAHIASLMAETGETEATLAGSVNDYRIHWSTPRESVKADAEATPDEFCKVERKPKLKEIGEHLKALRERNEPPLNWARFEAGERKLVWKATKR